MGAREHEHGRLPSSHEISAGRVHSNVSHALSFIIIADTSFKPAVSVAHKVFGSIENWLLAHQTTNKHNEEDRPRAP